MYNNNDEMYEVSDLDEDIRRREELIEQAKNIQVEADLNEAIREALALKRKWKRIQYWDSAFEDTLLGEFENYIDAIYAVRNEGYEKNQLMKQDLIEQARVFVDSDNWNKATDEMNVLMSQWKMIGSTGKESDDKLWDDFNTARQKFFDRKHKNWEDMQTKFGNARLLKQELIMQAAALSDSDDWQKTSEEYRNLMVQWKAAGNAGKQYEDQLWNEFHEYRQKFYERRNVYYDQIRGEQDEKFTAKKAFIEHARTIVDKKEFTKEHTEQMKNLGVDWKKIGSCGKGREDQIWKEFRSIMDDYFNGLKAWKEQKHTEWRQRMLATRNKKQELIAAQKRQIKYMQDEMVGLLGQRAIDEMEDSIEDKQEFIKELEAEVADIDKRLDQ